MLSKMNLKYTLKGLVKHLVKVIVSNGFVYLMFNKFGTNHLKVTVTFFHRSKDVLPQKLLSAAAWPSP